MSMDCMDCTGYQGSQDYIITDDVEKATHWIAYPDETSNVKEWIIPGKVYQVIDGDFILSEDGNFTCYYMNHKGDFIIMNNYNKRLN